jgi:lysophospholipase L1-like esterase
MASPSPSSSSFRRQVVLFGDSITQYSFDPSGGWGAALQHAYQRKADVLNRGFSGYNTRMALSMVDEVLPLPSSAPGSSSSSSSSSPSSRPLLATVFFGANDASDDARRPAGKPPQGVPVEEFEANVRALAARARLVVDPAAGCVVVISPPPVDNAAWPDRDNERVELYTAACAAAVGSLSVGADGDGAGGGGGASPPLVLPPVLHLDLYSLMMMTTLSSFSSSSSSSSSSLPAGDQQAAPWKAFLSDGLHLSPSGNAFVASSLLALISDRRASASPDSLPLDFPIWRDVDPANVAAYFDAAELGKLRSVAAPFTR